jgi:prolipoprotein diacylglyceryltransferase
MWFCFEIFIGTGEVKWGGTSFYGAVFGIPIVFLLISKLLKIRYAYIMDYCAPAGGAMLIAMKYRCISCGCCEGRVIRILEDGTEILFPSQLIELLIGAALCVVLVVLALKKNNKGVLYPYFLVMYGSTRFIMNFFRGDLTGRILFIPNGHLWSICAVLIGGVLLYKHYKTVNFQNSQVVG